jgi:hypothetical protein
MAKKDSTPPLEEGLLKAMRALDQQIARAMERSPADREPEGVQKWGPYRDKIEQVSSLLLHFLGDEQLKLDSVLVFSQALVKALKLFVHDMEGEGLGKLRSSYCQIAFENIERDALEGIKELQDPHQVGFLT